MTADLVGPAELAQLDSSAQEILSAAAGAQPRIGEWPPHLVLAHLSQVDEAVWLPRVEQMVRARRAGSSAPQFAWWEAAPGSTEATFGMLPPSACSTLLRESRSRLVATLAGLTEDEWTAIAHHTVFGVIDVAGLVREVLAHDAEHLQSLVD